jgi:hypothetical protein
MTRAPLFIAASALLVIPLALILQHRSRQSTAEPATASANAEPVTRKTNSRPGAVLASASTRQATEPVTNNTITERSESSDWAGRVEAARALEESDAEKSVRLLALFHTLPPEGQDEIAPELAALTPDSNYNALAGILTNPRTPEPVLDVLFTDLLDRPDEIQLRTLLELAKAPQHPKATDALDILGIELGEDFGTDWDAWAKKISEQLASRPE